MKVTGDIVAEWVAKTHQIFGKPVKTIVFASGVDHGTHLARKFQTEGYNFICISYKDDDEWKKQVIEDFSKPDTKIDGLIATDILTKGFDVPDVLIGVSARPFSKSLSSHIQQMGRVMRGCEGKEFAVWLDHSGNYLRFREDWDEVFEQGVDTLDEGKEKAKKEPSDKLKEESKCPKCAALWPKGSDTCYNCGHVREKKNQVIAVQGEMVELTAMASRETKQEFWNQMQYLIRYEGWSKGRAAHTYKDKFGVWPRALVDNRPQEPSYDTRKFINKKMRAFLKSIGR
jgi:superfamily II DNA or RNA helicase